MTDKATANRQKRRAEKAKARKGKAKSNVVPIKPKAGLVLTEVERLQMENLTLKMQVIQSAAKEQMAPHLARREQIGSAVGERLGIEIAAYNINLDSGMLEPVNGGPADPNTPQADGDGDDGVTPDDGDEEEDPPDDDDDLEPPDDGEPADEPDEDQAGDPEPDDDAAGDDADDAVAGDTPGDGEGDDDNDPVQGGGG